MRTKRRTPSARTAPDGLTATRNGLPHPGTPHDGGRASGPEHVGDIQRARILTAMVEVASERGVGNATVSHVVARSGVSRRTFYELFEDREDCFLAAFDEAVQWITAAVAPAYERERGWRERIRSGLRALLEFLEHEPGVGRLVIVQTLGAGPKALERRRRVLAQIIAIVDQGRGAGKAGDGLPPLTAEGVVGGVCSLIHSRLLDDGDAPLVELLNPLMTMIVLPYLGPAASRRELAQPTPKAPNGGRRVAADPLRDLEMRLTYRTVRVLLAIGAHPGASNRLVADIAGIRDQGQVSKLLARLEHLGLICNAGNAHAKGEPNAWTLTERGADVREAVSL
jgi:AcrR family transcriptional regulator